MFTEASVKNILSGQCADIFHISTKRPGILQVAMPFFYEDGDVVDIFIEATAEGKIRISDYGMALMRLSYSYEIDSPNKENIFNTIVAENRLQEDSGAIFLEVPPENLYPGLLSIASGISKIGSMKYFRKEVVKNLFYDDVGKFIAQRLSTYKPTSHVYPIADRDDLEVDYVLDTPHHPLYVFAVKGPNKAKIAAICCLEFQKAKISFRSIVIHENMESIGAKDRSRLTNAVDKQYTTLEAFTRNFEQYIERESL